MLAAGVSVIDIYIIALKELCTLLISSLDYDILYLFSGLFINVYAIVLFAFIY